MTFSNDLFLLMVNLSQLRNKEKIIQLFIESMQEVFSPAHFKFVKDNEKNEQDLLEIRTLNATYGYIGVSSFVLTQNEAKTQLHNAVQMLATILDHLEFDQRLKMEGDAFEKVAAERFSDLQQMIGELQAAKDASLNLINDLTSEIEKRIKIEQDLRQSEEQFRNLFEYSPLGKSMTSIDGVVKMNKAFCQMLGYSIEELENKNWKEITHPDDIKESEEIVSKILFGREESHRYEKRYLHKDGHDIWAEVNTNLQRDSNGNPLYFITNVNDISERKKMEEDLKESELTFRGLFEKGPIGVAYHRMIYDEMGIPVNYLFLDANQSYQKLTGVNPIGKLVTEAFPGIENDPFNWIGTFGNVAKNGIEIRFEQYLEVNDRWYDCVGYQYKPDHFVAAFLEITERKKAEQALQENEEKFRKMVESFPLAIHLSVGIKQVTEYINPAFVNLFGYTIEDLPSFEQWWVLAYPDENYRLQIAEEWTKRVSEAIANSSTIEPMDVVITCKDGSKKYVSWAYFSLGEKGYSCGLDLTDRKKAENELIDLKDALEIKVIEKTNELKERVIELERFHDATIDRELRMKELRDEISRLKSTQ
ncbi:MAG: hypothetical protein CVT92_07815 [Bacteroidetes bacterium HGW-Bacteroidetes-1]|jgi:PAS domain S-box-containing protein|nr:MAG: hypothetical protein CVT92_07815 [Bacteroidetes bacterium HGW-Bacteroidetes-1]